MGLSLNLQLPTADLMQKQANQQYLALLNKTNFANFMGSQLTGLISDGIGDAFGNSGIGRLIGNVFGNGLGSVGSTVLDNYLKGNTLMQGIGKNLGASLQGAASGLAADFAGKGVNALMGNSKLGNFMGGATSSALGQVLGGGIGNPLVFGSNVAGSALSSMLGPSKEYGGKYGNVTQTMDSIYGAVQGAAGLFGPVGMGFSAAMSLNKGLSNLFGSTDGMTVQDAILGSAFMLAPVKWLNAGLGKKTGSFDNQSWQNQEKANSFMLNGFGDLGERFDLARNEANKKYGLFSQHARRKAQRNIDFANNAWDLVLAMADQNELQNIRSQYMSSINNQRYALMINGGFQPLAVGKQGMKILNNQTNHNMGLRLLSAAALIDNKQMILSALGGTKLTRLRPKPLPKKPATREENPELWDEWERRETEQLAARLQVYNLERLAATQRAETNARHALHYSNLAMGVAETAQQNTQFEPVTQESLQNSNTERLRQELLDDKNEYFDRGMDFINAAGFADLGVNVAGPLLLRGFRWAFNKAGLLVRVPINRFTIEGNTSSIENTQNFIPDFSKMTRDEKLLWLKTLQELAYRVDLARTLDALHMTKTRVKLGGAKRLDNAFSDDMYSSPEESTFSENLKLGHTTDELEKMAMEKNLLENVKKKPIRGTAELISNKMNDAGISDRLTTEDGAVAYRNELYTDVPSDAGFNLKGFRKGLKGAAHEFVHFLYQPISKPRGMNFPKSYIGDYLSGEGPIFETTGATEISARGTQIKNYFGLKEGELITPEMWNYAARHYMKDVGDNDMSTMFKLANTTSLEFPYVLKWINKHAPAVIPITVGGSTAATLYNSHKKGGKILKAQNGTYFKPNGKYSLISSEHSLPEVLIKGKNKINAETFLGKVTKLLGGSPTTVRFVDEGSSTALLIRPYGYILGGLDLGSDIYDAIKGDENKDWTDVALDAASLLPWVNKLGLKNNPKGLLKWMYNNRKTINNVSNTAKGVDYVNDSHILGEFKESNPLLIVTK